MDLTLKLVNGYSLQEIKAVIILARISRFARCLAVNPSKGFIGSHFVGLPIPAKVLTGHDLQSKVAISSILHKWQGHHFHCQEDDLDEPSAERFPRHRGKGIKGSWLG